MRGRNSQRPTASVVGLGFEPRVFQHHSCPFCLPHQVRVQKSQAHDPGGQTDQTGVLPQLAMEATGFQGYSFKTF